MANPFIRKTTPEPVLATTLMGLRARQSSELEAQEQYVSAAGRAAESARVARLQADAVEEAIISLEKVGITL